MKRLFNQEIMDRTDDFFDRVCEIFHPNVSDFNFSKESPALKESLSELIIDGAPVLAQWPHRILASPSGLPAHTALLEGWRQACMKGWLNDLLSPGHPDHLTRAHVAWDQLRPVALASHLQVPPPALDDPQPWLRNQGGMSYAVAQHLREGHPAWHADRQSQWAIALITGISSSSSAKRNRVFAQLLSALLPKMTPDHWAQVEAKKLMPFWESRQHKSSDLMAAWRQWRAREVQPFPADVTHRARRRP
jgi:hypothetical protein